MAGKREAQKAETKAKIVAQARAMFRAEGYDAVSMRAVAKAAGMTTGAIFAHFSGKEALYVAALESPAPDVRGFLAKIRNADGYEPIGALQNDADALFAALYGGGQ